MAGAALVAALALAAPGWVEEVPAKPPRPLVIETGHSVVLDLSAPVRAHTEGGVVVATIRDGQLHVMASEPGELHLLAGSTHHHFMVQTVPPPPPGKGRRKVPVFTAHPGEVIVLSEPGVTYLRAAREDIALVSHEADDVYIVPFAEGQTDVVIGRATGPAAIRALRVLPGEPRFDVKITLEVGDDYAIEETGRVFIVDPSVAGFVERPARRKRPAQRLLVGKKPGSTPVVLHQGRGYRVVRVVVR